MAKGQGSTLSVLIGVAIVAVIGISLSFTRTDVLSQNLLLISEQKEDYRNDLVLRTLMTSEIAMGDEEDSISKERAIIYACKYGHENNYNIRVKPASPRININQTIKTYLNETLDENFYLYSDCGENPSMVIGEPPPENLDVTSSRYIIPLPKNKTTEVRLKRWYR